ncbi:MAG: acylphosphatase [Terriglobales bacterium]
MDTARFEVFGRVQGVGFRYFAQLQAVALGLRGTVRNRSDGAVEVHAAGPTAALQKLEQHLRTGPRGAIVTQVQRSAWPLPPAEMATVQGFTIVE